MYDPNKGPDLQNSVPVIVLLLPTVDKTYTVGCRLVNPHVDISPSLVICNFMHVSDINASLA